MKVVPNELPEYVDRSFTSDNDLFNLRGYGEQLESFIKQSRTPLTMVLNGGWGSGKTVFSRQWHSTLKDNGWTTIYFDCYAHDYHEDPLIPLSAKILSTCARKADTDSSAGVEFRKSVIAAAKALLPVGAKVGTNLATAGMVSSDDLSKVHQRYTDERSESEQGVDVTDEILLEQLLSEMGDDTPSRAFRRGLENLVEEAQSDGPQYSGKPMVLILDELDRCQPDFSLRLLERVKHFFAVPGICFFFVTNLEELSGVVTHRYGIGNTARTYLEKFFDVQTSLPQPERYPSTQACNRMKEYLLKELQIPSMNNELLSDSVETATEICIEKGVSLRTFQRIITHIALYFRAAGKDIGPPPIVAGLAVFKQIDPAAYARAARGEIKWSEVKEELALKKLNLTDGVVGQISDWWKYATEDGALEEERMTELGRMLRGFRVRDRTEIPRVMAQTMDSFASFDGA